jgi:predicted DNA-binding transcriptional regulator AlpA
VNHPNVKVLERQALAPRDVSIAYGISEGTLANWRCKRVGPKFYRLGGRKVAYFRSDLEAWAQREPVLTKDCVGA